MDSENVSTICVTLIILVALLLSSFSAMKDVNAIKTLEQEKYQMMKVLVDNGLASYTFDPNTGVASITYLVRDKKGDK